MSTSDEKSRRKSGDYVVATFAPGNRLAEPHFGLLDGVIVLLFVVCASMLVYLILG